MYRARPDKELHISTQCYSLLSSETGLGVVELAFRIKYERLEENYKKGNMQRRLN